jgi:hypothetical protein
MDQKLILSAEPSDSAEIPRASQSTSATSTSVASPPATHSHKGKADSTHQFALNFNSTQYPPHQTTNSLLNPPSSSLFNISNLRSRLTNSRSQPTLSNTQVHNHTYQSTAASTASVPVLVTAYSGPRLRSSRLGMGPRSNSSTTGPVPALPPISSFSFAHILTTIEPQIQDSLDAISLICARSRYSLADEYAAHLPPQGEILAGTPLPVRGRHGLWIRTAGLDGNGAALSVVHEGGSSSGASETGTMRSAYGSLRDVLMNKGKAPAADNGSGIEKFSTTSDLKSSSGISFSWAVVRRDGEKSESIVLVGPPQASRQLSTTTVVEQASEDGVLEPILASSLPPTPSAGMPSWLLPWKRPPSITSLNLDRPSAESVLRSLFTPPDTQDEQYGAG